MLSPAPNGFGATIPNHANWKEWSDLGPHLYDASRGRRSNQTHMLLANILEQLGDPAAGRRQPERIGASDVRSKRRIDRVCPSNPHCLAGDNPAPIDLVQRARQVLLRIWLRETSP